jgi:hypothetical protein
MQSADDQVALMQDQLDQADRRIKVCHHVFLFVSHLDARLPR